jgi:hypothetical protein
MNVASAVLGVGPLAASPLAVVLAVPDDGSRRAGPMALLVISLLAIAAFFLVRSMLRHLRRVPPSFDRSDEPRPPDDRDPGSS